MLDIQQIVLNKVKQMEEDKTIEKLIEENIAKTVESTINDVFRSWGDFGEGLRNQIKSQLNIDLSSLKLQEYNAFIIKFLEENIDSTIKNVALENLKELINGFLTINMPAQLTVTELIDMFKESITLDDMDVDESDAYDYGHQDISLNINNEGGFCYISLDALQDKSEYRCYYRIGLHNNKVFTIKIKDEEITAKDVVSCLYDFDKKLYKMFAVGTTIIFDKGYDEGDYDISVDLVEKLGEE